MGLDPFGMCFEIIEMVPETPEMDPETSGMILDHEKVRLQVAVVS